MLKTVQRYAATIVTFLVFTSGLVNLISIFRPITSSFLSKTDQLYYLPVATTSRIATIIISILLLTTARGLWHKNKDAWNSAFLLTSASIFFHLLKGFNFEELFSSAVIFIILLWTRRMFVFESKTKLGIDFLKDLISALIYFFIYYLVGILLLQKGFIGQLTPLVIISNFIYRILGLSFQSLIPQAREARLFNQSLSLIFLGILITFLLRLFENLISRAEEKNPLEILPLIKEYGEDTLSYFATNSKKEYFFSPSRQAFLPYVIKNNFAIAAGDPIGPQPEIIPLIKAFKNYWNSKNIPTAFFSISERYLNTYRQLGYKPLKFGEEAVVEVQKYDFPSLYPGRHGKRFRRAVRYIEELGISFELHSLKTLPATYYSQMIEISEKWLKTFSVGEEKGFSMNLARLPNAYDTDCRIALAIKKNEPIPEVVGYLILTPVYNRAGYSLDVMRRKPDSPNGLNEFLIVKTLGQLKKEGQQLLSLNFAPLGESKTAKSTILSKIRDFIADNFKGALYMNTLYEFNQKFFPTWKSRYLAYEKTSDFPTLILAIFSLEGYLDFNINYAKRLVKFLRGSSEA